jgi:hypothetical protein
VIVSHTNIPWSTRTGRHLGETLIVGDNGRQVIGYFQQPNIGGSHEDNALRTISCVNACAGIPNDYISNVVSFGLQGHNKVSDDLMAARDALLHEGMQRDDLLAALHAIVAELNQGLNCSQTTIRKITQEAIASVEESAVVKDSLTTEISIPALVFYPAGSLGEEVQP